VVVLVWLVGLAQLRLVVLAVLLAEVVVVLGLQIVLLLQLPQMATVAGVVHLSQQVRVQLILFKTAFFI
jgi:hypothetical protein